jgi:hypothetical protein
LYFFGKLFEPFSLSWVFEFSIFFIILWQLYYGLIRPLRGHEGWITYPLVLEMMNLKKSFCFFLLTFVLDAVDL